MKRISVLFIVGLLLISVCACEKREEMSEVEKKKEDNVKICGFLAEIDSMDNEFRNILKNYDRGFSASEDTCNQINSVKDSVNRIKDRYKSTSWYTEEYKNQKKSLESAINLLYSTTELFALGLENNDYRKIEEAIKIHTEYEVVWKEISNFSLNKE